MLTFIHIILELWICSGIEDVSKWMVCVAAAFSPVYSAGARSKPEDPACLPAQLADQPTKNQPTLLQPVENLSSSLYFTFTFLFTYFLTAHASSKTNRKDYAWNIWHKNQRLTDSAIWNSRFESIFEIILKRNVQYLFSLYIIIHIETQMSNIDF